MADDVGLQRDVTVGGDYRPRTLHLKLLRKQWQIIALQIIATVALVGMYLEVVSTYVVGSIDHTMLFDTIEVLIGQQLPIGDFLTGEGNTALDGSLYRLSSVCLLVVAWHSLLSKHRKHSDESNLVSSSH